MATASTTTTVNNPAKATAGTQTSDAAKNIREQMLSTVRQSQEMSLDAAQTWVKVISELPIPKMPAIPGAAAVPSVDAMLMFTFDVAADLLSAQREFAFQIVKIFAPDKSV